MGIKKDLAEHIKWLVNVKGIPTGEVAKKFNIPEHIIVNLVRRD